jgi:hypothetical protein
MLRRADIHQRVLAPSAVHFRLAAGGLDVLVMLLFVVPSALLTVTIGIVSQFPYETSPRSGALFGWMFLSVLSVGWLLYLCRGFVGGGPQAGAAKLRLFAEAGERPHSNRRVRVWLLLNHLPLFVFAITSWSGCIYTIAQDRRTFGSEIVAPALGTYTPAAVLSGLSLVSLAFALGPERRSLYDRLAGVRVVRPTFLQHGGVRGFAVGIDHHASPMAVGDRPPGEYPSAT